MSINKNKSIDLSLLIFRVGISLLMIFNHGIFKFSRLTGPDEILFSDPFGLGPTASLVLALTAELGCSILIILGLWTRWATIPLMFTMLVATYIKLTGEINEMAILYFLSYFILFFTGPGKYALDAVLSEKTKE